MVVSLSGMMGCGKSTVGPVLAQALGVPFLDLDACIEASAGRSIAEIFREEGEAGFRARESAVLADTLDRVPDCVLALGGGTLTTPANLALVRSRTCNIYLKTSPETLVRRLEHGREQRPLLREGSLRERIEALLAARADLYASAAAHVISTDEKLPGEIAGEILQKI